MVGNLVKNCTETFLSEEGTVRGSSVGDTESNVSAARRFSSDSGNSSGEEYPYFIGKQCREYLDNPSNVSREYLDNPSNVSREYLDNPSNVSRG